MAVCRRGLSNPLCPSIKIRPSDDMVACAGPPAIDSESHIDVRVDPPGPFRYIPDFLLQSVGEAALKASLATLQAGL